MRLAFRNAAKPADTEIRTVSWQEILVHNGVRAGKMVFQDLGHMVGAAAMLLAVNDRDFHRLSLSLKQVA
jgi:hypothetical protein